MTWSAPSRRGLTLVELTLSMSITAMIGLAITGMLAVVSTGVTSKRDGRATMVRADAAQVRLSAYLGPSRCVLDHDGTNAVIWLDDAREGGTVHTSEIRWLRFDAGTGTIDVHLVRLPEAWSKTARDLADAELAPNADWEAVFVEAEADGHTASLPLVDGLRSVSVSANDPDPQRGDRLFFDLEFALERGSATVPVTATVRQHVAPR